MLFFTYVNIFLINFHKYFTRINEGNFQGKVCQQTSIFLGLIALNATPYRMLPRYPKRGNKHLVGCLRVAGTARKMVAHLLQLGNRALVLRRCFIDKSNSFGRQREHLEVCPSCILTTRSAQQSDKSQCRYRVLAHRYFSCYWLVNASNEFRRVTLFSS